MSKKLAQEVQQYFQITFASEPLLVFSPGRINLIGEHTDYNEGFAFPAAINKGIVMAIAQSTELKSTICALNNKETYKFYFDGIKPLKNGGWRNYILGVISELQKLGKSIQSFNAVFKGNLPIGAGLSSSAALANSVVFGLNALFELQLTKYEMILVAQKAEHFTGVQCGIMDQYASMFGVRDAALLLDCRAMTSKVYQMNIHPYCWVLVDTHVKHRLRETAYNMRQEVCTKVASLLKVKSLRGVTHTMLQGIQAKISHDHYQKAHYVLEENKRVSLFAKAAKNKDLEAMGRLMYQSHEGLKNQYQVSCNELDFLVNHSKAHPGIIGARMMGGGFGGCVLLLIKKEAIALYKKDVSKTYRNVFKHDCFVYDVKLSKGTHFL